MDFNHTTTYTCPILDVLSNFNHDRLFTPTPNRSSPYLVQETYKMIVKIQDFTWVRRKPRNRFHLSFSHSLFLSSSFSIFIAPSLFLSFSHFFLSLFPLHVNVPNKIAGGQDLWVGEFDWLVRGSGWLRYGQGYSLGMA